MSYAVYGARTRADGYPSAMYRVPLLTKPANAALVAVEQYAHGQWLPVRRGEPIRLSWIEEQLEKGLLWKLENGTKPWNDPAVTPPYLAKLNCCVAMLSTQAAEIADGDFAAALSKCQIHVVSRSTFMQKRTWFIAQRSVLGQHDGDVVTTSPDMSFFTNDAASLKFYKAWAGCLYERQDVVLRVPAPKGADELLSWWERLSRAAENHMIGAEQERRAEAERIRWETSIRLGGLVERLRELTAKPTTELSSAEFVEKMRLKREVGSHGC